MMNKNYIGKEVGEVYDKRGSRIHTGMVYGKKLLSTSNKVAEKTQKRMFKHKQVVLVETEKKGKIWVQIRKNWQSLIVLKMRKMIYAYTP